MKTPLEEVVVTQAREIHELRESLERSGRAAAQQAAVVAEQGRHIAAVETQLQGQVEATERECDTAVWALEGLHRVTQELNVVRGNLDDARNALLGVEDDVVAIDRDQALRALTHEGEPGRWDEL